MLLCASGSGGAAYANHDGLRDGLLLDGHPRCNVGARRHRHHVLLLLLLLLLFLLLSGLLGDVLGRVLRVSQALLLHQLLLIRRAPRLLLLDALGPI